MTTLQAEKRDPQVKAKRLRREGYTTGILFGKELEETVMLQYPQKDALQFIKQNKEGARVTLALEDKKIKAIVKNIDYDPTKKQIMALDLQALVAGEKISTAIQIRLINEEAVPGFVSQELNEVHYKADPEHLLEPVEIDLSKLSPEIKNYYVKDLGLEEKGVELLTPESAQIFHIGEVAAEEGEEESAEEADI